MRVVEDLEKNIPSYPICGAIRHRNYMVKQIDLKREHITQELILQLNVICI